jgi:hypothetical protein
MITNLDSIFDFTSKLTFSTLSHLKRSTLSLNYKHLLYLFKIKALTLLCIRLYWSKQSQASLLGLNYFCIYVPVLINR